MPLPSFLGGECRSSFTSGFRTRKDGGVEREDEEREDDDCGIILASKRGGDSLCVLLAEVPQWVGPLRRGYTSVVRRWPPVVGILPALRF
jgi:hypothetical protein